METKRIAKPPKERKRGRERKKQNEIETTPQQPIFPKEKIDHNPTTQTQSETKRNHCPTTYTVTRERETWRQKQRPPPISREK